MEDDRKIYEIVENKSLEEKRKSKEGTSIPGCRKARMISIFPDGTYQLKKDVCDCEYCLYGRFNECCANEEEVNVITLDPEFKEELDELPETDDRFVNDVFVEEENYVALYSSMHFKLFYIFYVMKKCVATDSICNVFGHRVLKGECYLEGYTLEKNQRNERSNFV